jgi:hypothetical protein
MAEPKAYEPEKQTAIVHLMDLKKTTFAVWQQDCARSGTTTLRRSSGGVGWFRELGKAAYLGCPFFAQQIISLLDARH